MHAFTNEQNERLKDLLKEKSLWQVYGASLKIPLSKFNVWFGAVVAVTVTLFATQSKSSAILADRLVDLSRMAFLLAISQLGFLLAGFSFFAIVAEKEMFCRMAEKTHQDSGLSYLKYNFLVFMRVFVEYLAFALFCLWLMVALTEGFGVRGMASDFLDQWPLVKHCVVAAIFGVFVGSVVYLLMQLASFIFNVYHVVMTTVRWALQRDYEASNIVATDQQQQAESSCSAGTSV